MPYENTHKIALTLLLCGVIFLQSCNQPSPSANNTADTTRKATTSAAMPAAGDHCLGSNCFDTAGTTQSPVNIFLNQSNYVVTSKNIITIKLQPGITPMKCFLDTSHGDKYANMSAYVPALSDANFVDLNGVRYQFQRLHFHRPLEHNIAAPVTNPNTMEMHCVFVNTSMPHNAVVLGVVFNIEGSNNPFIDSLWPKFDSIVNNRLPQPQPVNVNFNNIGGKSLITYFANYWSYAGSLTTPCYQEGVTWFVARGTGTVSQAQFNQFASFKYKGTIPIGPARDSQRLGNRLLIFR